MEVYYAIAWQSGSVRSVENSKAHSIEANQTLKRPKPKITVLILSHCGGGILGQPVLSLPCFGGPFDGVWAKRGGNGGHGLQNTGYRYRESSKDPLVPGHIKCWP